MRFLVLAAAASALTACDDLLEVDLPYLLTDEAIKDAGSAALQVNSAIALFECGLSTFGWIALGHEDVSESIAGVAGSVHVFRDTPVAGTCDQSAEDQSWFDQVMGARALISRDPGLLVATADGDAGGVYDRIQNEWDLGVEGERLSAIASIYMAASLEHFGDFFCEGALDGSDLITPGEFLTMAEQWADRAINTHIPGAGGDFGLPNGITPVSGGAMDMAVALRARIRWANGDLMGAANDATAVPDGFTAWITRETGEQRRNKTFIARAFAGMLGINTWWDGPNRNPNPANGQLWPATIPFTGYLFLGIMPDGRALEVDNTPVRWAEEFRAMGDPPTPLGNGAVADTRVPHDKEQIQGPEPREVPTKYLADDDNIPLVSWREMRLIRAEYEHAQGNFQNAIDQVNVLRQAAGLPEILPPAQYHTDLLADADMVRAMIIEERRRELFNEGGRYWAAKIRNTDLLWFPRREGNTPFQGYPLQGGVRLLFDGGEYQLNPYFEALGGLDARATGCAMPERPIYN